MYEATNIAAASSHKADLAFVAVPSTVEICSGRRTELARASSGNLH
jgi:hypothetical protein